MARTRSGGGGGVELPVSGLAGAEPPAGAPREVSQPLTGEYLSSAKAKARVNERELAPLRVPGPVEGNAASQGSVGEPVAAVHEVVAPGGVQAAGGGASLSRGYQTASSRRQPHVGNGSDDPVTSGPTRGIPTPQPVGKEITGGFGVGGGMGAGQYFALNGLEVQEAIAALQGHLAKQVREDLRFSIALTYPRVSLKLKLEVVTYPVDHSFDLEHKHEFEGATEEEAASMAEREAFTIEASVSDSEDSPPNLIREELDLEIPQRQLVPGTTMRSPMFADRVSEPAPVGQRKQTPGINRPSF